MATKKKPKPKQGGSKKPPQDMKRKARVRAARNKSGKDTDYQAAVARGDENAGKDSASNKAHKLRRNMKKNGTKFEEGEDAGHKKASKDGGSSSASNGRKESSSSNRSKGGKSGDPKGKAKGGRKSKRK